MTALPPDPVSANVATVWRMWWGQSDRTIHRINPETVAALQRVGIGYLPETPPPSWRGPLS
jgi:hypothetical protein